MHNLRSLVDLGLDAFAVLCWAFVAYVLLLRFGFRQASLVLAGTFAAVALVALVGDWFRDRRQEALLRGRCPRCNGDQVSRFHQCRAFRSDEERWQEPATAWQCESCGYSVSEAIPCNHCPERPGLWPR